MITTSGLAHLTRTLVGARNRADWAGYRALAHPEFAYEEGGTDRRISDVDDVIMAWQRVRAAFPDMTAAIVEIRQAGPVSTATVVWQATEADTEKRLEILDALTSVWADDRVLLERHRLGFLSMLEPLLPRRAGPADPE